MTKRLSVVLAFALIGSVTFASAQQQQESFADIARRAEAERAARAKREQADKDKAAPDAQPGEAADKALPPTVDDKGTSKTAKKTYTNKDLKAVPPPSTPATAPILPSASPVDESLPVEKSEFARDAEYRHEAKKDEAYWKARMQGLQLALERDSVNLSAMEARVRTLSAEFDASNSVSQRAVLRIERESAATEVARLRAAANADRINISTAEDEARRADVPPGWLRP